MSFLASRVVLISGVVSLLGAAAPAVAQQTRLRAEWAGYARLFRDQPGRRVTLACPPGEQPSKIFGTDAYTDDSSVCSAAVHAGVISAEKGGAITIVIGKGMRSFEGSTRNGITSEKAGSYDGSFSFERDASGLLDWSTTGAGIEWVGRPLTLVCPPNGETGRIWGTDTYHGDSSICSAAVHAGRITARAGGEVTIESAGAQNSFDGSERNGVASIKWPAGPVSFRIASAPADPVVTAPTRLPPTPSQPAPTALATTRSINVSTLSITGIFTLLATSRNLSTPQLSIAGLFIPIVTARKITTPTLAIQGQK